LRDPLAERVLAQVMGWGPAQLADGGSRLQTLARHKYDGYEGYRPGVKFLENLAAWLDQFEDIEDRRAAVRFVLEDLVFVSRAELDHLVETVYPDWIRPMLIREAAAEVGESPFAVSRVTESDTFRAIQRKLLVLGLSDGARIDRLRRASPGLSHEQIYLATDIGDKTADQAVEKLRKVISESDAAFEHVLLVDDFYGSGRTLLRKDPESGEQEGRLWKTKERLDKLQSERGVLVTSYRVSILVYLASSTAIEHVRSSLAEAELSWEFEVIQELPDSLKVDEPTMVDLCRRHWDPVLEDEHKGAAPLGFGEAALPLVLHHNSPNNSVCPIWADTTDRTDGMRRRALFPRYERHHVSRP
jgi:hypothetical protein